MPLPPGKIEITFAVFFGIIAIVIPFVFSGQSMWAGMFMFSLPPIATIWQHYDYLYLQRRHAEKVARIEASMEHQTDGEER